MDDKPDSPEREEQAEAQARTRHIAGRLWAELRVACAFLTCIPVPPLPEGTPEPTLGHASRMFPVVGLAVGLIGGLSFAFAEGIGLEAATAAFVGLAAMALATGALHEDGLADAADGLGGGSTPERRLEIMRDSRIGTFGVLTLILTVGLKVTALVEIDRWGGTVLAADSLIAAAALSRAAMVAVAASLPIAGTSGLAAHAGRPSSDRAWLAVIIGALIALVCIGLEGLLAALVIGGGLAIVLARLARRRIGGYNGDTLGAIQQVAETGILLGLAAVL